MLLSICLIMKTQIDHIVIGAADLAQGVAYVRERLGVEVPFGGVHETMGTHNHLMQLGNNSFLEIIAVNPGGGPVGRPRWYGLDDPLVRQRISVQPVLLAWVVNTTDINALLLNAGISFGKATFIRRDNLSWYFGLPGDGRLLAAGLLPYVIEWQTESHPAVNMADLGCRLLNLHIHHSRPEWVGDILKSINARGLVTVHSLPENETPYLAADIRTPSGVKTLKGIGA